MNNQKSEGLWEAWSHMVRCILHDLTPPLKAVNFEGNEFKERLPELLKGYQLAVAHQLIKPKLDHEALQEVEVFPDSLRNNLNKLFDFLNLATTLNKKLSIPLVEEEKLNLNSCLQEAIKNYPFTSKQTQKLHIDYPSDIYFEYSPLFIQHLLCNLLDAGFSRIERMRQGEIHIWVEEKTDEVVLHFENTAGISATENFSHLFKHFFVKHHGNTIPGLGYCRLKLLSEGGDIVCNVVKEQYTDFESHFPKM